MIINNITLFPVFRLGSSHKPIFINKACYDNKLKLSINEIRKDLQEHNLISNLMQNYTVKTDLSQKLMDSNKQINSFAYTILQTKVRKLAHIQL